ncbi:ATP-binding protein [Devosia limi DSM 17137]|uniref:ATP-binding protein n=1 Tax=Devosia limi DSM 17137 TaxID=1121477 RepID=A0A0F5LQD4_9HYPH|nr:AAA family ATPase [Devosia limi]KKB84354.1 ATP-binding protein [Devosia limi DSM 17137]SHF63229.1 exodeoxyribonuclease-5 [Devosia limi DSM 17137]
MVEWSPQQDEALVAVAKWLKDKNGPQVFRLFGWAGTGKSTLAVHLGQDVKTIKYAAFTGKAALVMRKRGCKGAQTIHSLIYSLVSEKEGEPRFVLDPESPAADADLIVIDEVSMVDEQLGRDLLSFGVKVLVLGDPFQLPPVQGAGFFTSEEPDIMLTEIHRQAADNPIIRLSMDIREGGYLERGRYGESLVVGREDVDRNAVLEADQVLVGRNKTRLQYNDRLRELRGLPFHEPVEGDRMVCLRNNPRKRLLNGQIWICTEVTRKANGKYSLLLGADEGKGEAKVLTHKAFFSGEEDQMSWQERRQYDEFTFGYCLTVHKAQGSQWDNVYLFDESFVFREERARWLYTGITRAAERITVVS